MEIVGGTNSEPGPWIVGFGPEDSRMVGRFGQIVELVLEGKVGRDALLREPSGRSCLVGDVPGLAVLFEDEQLRRFLLHQRRSTKPACLPKLVGLRILAALSRLVRCGTRAQARAAP
jgi:hypothetical protein